MEKSKFDAKNIGRSVLYLGLAVGSLTLAGCMGRLNQGNREVSTPQGLAPSPTPGTTAVYNGTPYPGPNILVNGSRHLEVVQFDNLSTFGDYRNASSPGPLLHEGAKLIIDCVASGPVAAAPSAVNSKTGKAEWYHIEEVQSDPGTPDADLQAPDGMYTAANSFINGSNLSLPLSEQNPVDPSVPACPPLGTQG